MHCSPLSLNVMGLNLFDLDPSGFSPRADHPAEPVQDHNNRVRRREHLIRTQATSFDHRVSHSQQRKRDFKAECHRGFAIYHQLELDSLLYG
jgi:hypothetical protein